LAEGVSALREYVEALYRAGIDLPKLAYWMRAHEFLLAPRRACSVAFAWAHGAPGLLSSPSPSAGSTPQDDDSRSAPFYNSLQQKLEPRRPRRSAA